MHLLPGSTPSARVCCGSLDDISDVFGSALRHTSSLSVTMFRSTLRVLYPRGPANLAAYAERSTAGLKSPISWPPVATANILSGQRNSDVDGSSASHGEDNTLSGIGAVGGANDKISGSHLGRSYLYGSSQVLPMVR